MSEDNQDEKLQEVSSFRKLGDIAFTVIKEEKSKSDQANFRQHDPIYADDVDIGAIDLSFPEYPESEFYGITNFPQRYYTLSPKERLVLLFAENFRRQFLAKFPNRQPLVLAVPNECGVQKFVSMTLRPTGFYIPELIGSLEECAKFVADYFLYEPFEDPTNLPKRLISPDTLLKHRQGNSFEMATLLCSMLIGAGFAAVVVSGRAVRETALNDQRKVICPFIPKDDHDEGCANEGDPQNEVCRYSLRQPPNLNSKFIEKQEDLAAKQEAEELERQRKEEIEMQELLEKEPDDPFVNRRVHAWVAVIENAPWCYKPKTTPSNKEGRPDEDTPKEPVAFFIEPSTGFRHEVDSSNYVRIDSIWNHHNYYINIQESSIADMHWDLGNPEEWICFLPGEPYELRRKDVDEDEVAKVQNEKHLDLIPSWVQQLRITYQQFEERYPNQEKTILYKKAQYERFSPYHKKDGLLTRLILYEDSDCERPSIRWEWYQNREDCMEMKKINYEMKRIEESFVKGRPDCLKWYEHSADPDSEKIFHFYHTRRMDSLKLLEVSRERIALHFEKRCDLVFYREYLFNSKHHITVGYTMTEITEKYHRNSEIPHTKDIAIRRYKLLQNKIFLKYHYAQDAITASTREFTKPPKQDHGQEVLFDRSMTSGYKANPLEQDPTPLDLYLLLISELANEKKLMKAFIILCDDIDEILSNRDKELENPKLKFSVFDPLRNQGARNVVIQQYEEEKRQKEYNLLHDPDFLAPYLVPYEGRKMTPVESTEAYDACLRDVKDRYTNLLNSLQRRYEDLTSDSRSLKNFISKFHDQFDKYDYERLVKEGKEIELKRRMVQQRLILTHEEAQRKYENIKKNLLNDHRLNFKADNRPSE